MENFRTFQLSVKFFQQCQSIRLPRYLKDQLNRASSSISLNLAEGHGKFTQKDQRKYFSISLGSLRECQAILTLANLKSSEAFYLADYLGASIYKLINSHK